ncbi:MAG TPA: molybdopterin cofactor-binding domain-containing protein [Anaerolineae bacterium]|nr:molybdopterin cofactor-binding domain-containing protein [Anaerolineae bacterium]
MVELNLTVNGKPLSVEIEPNEYLAYVLRYKLGLTGTKIGCDEAECGACTVIVNGTAVDSCIYPALKAQGADVLTIEGLADTWQGRDTGTVPLHPLQGQFIQQGAVQCGYCTPGILMQSKALLDENPNPTDDDIKVALKDTYCRCGCYVSIMNAIKHAAQEIREPDQPHHFAIPNLPQVKTPLKVIGKPIPRPDAVAKVSGAAKYTDDYSLPDMLWGATLRPKHPHANILRIDTSKARALPGVHAVLTHEDVPGSKNHGLIYNDWPVLCYDKVRYEGDAVAIVAAETRELAQRALDLIEVEYEPLPIVDNPIDALKPETIIVNDGTGHGNLLKHIHVEKGNVEKGFEEADVVVENEYHSPFYEQAFLEPECSIGRPLENGRIEVIVGSQIPYEDRRQIAAALNVEESKIRVRGALIGGGFGGKEDIAAQIHVALLAQKTGRPVKMLYSRHESLIFHPKRHATIIRLKTGAKKDGTIIASQATIYGDSGAYASLGDKVMTRAATHAAGPYNIPNVKIDCYAMYTNNPPAGAFRGFGVTQSAFAVESNMDEIAHQLGIDSFELRRKNALTVGGITSTGQVVRESAGLLECIRLVENRVKSGSSSQSKIENQKSKIQAWGFAAAYKNTGLGGGAPDKSAAEVEVFEDGTAEVRTSAAEIGQGLPTVLAMITAEELGLPYERVRVLLSDTDLTPDGGPTTASRQTFVTGNAARYAAKGMREILAETASEYLDAAPEQLVFKDGFVRQNGHRLPFAEVVKRAREENRPTRYLHEYLAPATKPLGTEGDMHFGFSYAAQAALVEVDTNTGEVHVLKIVTATDIGRALNPLALQGQVEGGIMMCLGNALTEEYIVEHGKVWTDLLAKYKMPSIKHTPEIVSFLVEDEISSGPYGAKGVGEISSIPTTPAITNAIYNAVGVRIRRLPVDQDALLLAMRAGHKQIN